MKAAISHVRGVALVILHFGADIGENWKHGCVRSVVAAGQGEAGGQCDRALVLGVGRYNTPLSPKYWTRGPD